MALEAQGVRVYWCTSTAASTASASALIAEVNDFTGPGGAAGIIDVSHLLSTAREKLVGLRDEGQLSLTLNYSATDAAHINLRADRAARTKKKCVIEFGDTTGTYGFFDAYCMQYSISGAVDNKITANAVLEITGAVSYATVV